MTIKTTFEPIGGELNVNYYGNTASTDGAAIRFHKQKLDGTGYDLANTIYLGNNSGSFHINDKYTGFHAAYYSTNGGSTMTAVTPKGSDGYYGSAVSYGNSGLDVYFDRTSYKLSFFTNNAGNDMVEYSVPYETDIPITMWMCMDTGAWSVFESSSSRARAMLTSALRPFASVWIMMRRSAARFWKAPQE